MYQPPRRGRAMTTREPAERIMRLKEMPATDDRRHELAQKMLLGSLNESRRRSFASPSGDRKDNSRHRDNQITVTT
jgi:hypothetical protein